MPLYDEYRGGRCVLLKAFRDIVADDSFKYYHVSTGIEFMWVGVNLRVS